VLVGETDLFSVSGKEYDPATFEVRANPLAPVANPDAITTNAGTAVSVAILANDTVSGGPVPPGQTTITILPPGEVTGPANGSVTLGQDGTVIYTPGAGFAGTDSFAYQITVNGLLSNAATATVDVAPVETIGLTRARFETRRLRLDLGGTSTFEGTTLTIHAGPTAGNPIGIAVVRNGRWSFRGAITENVTSVSVVSNSAAATTLLDQPLQVR
jgi:hypothetical protein